MRYKYKYMFAMVGSPRGMGDISRRGGEDHNRLFRVCQDDRHTMMGFWGTSLHLDSLIRLFYATEADPGTGRVYYSCMESKEKRPEREAGGGGRGIAPSINVLPDGSFNVTQCISMYLNVTQCTSIYLNVPQSTLMYFKTLQCMHQVQNQ